MSLFSTPLKKGRRVTIMESKTKGNRRYAQGDKQGAIEAYSQGIALVEEEGGQQGAQPTEDDKNCLHVLYANLGGRTCVCVATTAKFTPSNQAAPPQPKRGGEKHDTSVTFSDSFTTSGLTSPSVSARPGSSSSSASRRRTRRRPKSPSACISRGPT